MTVSRILGTYHVLTAVFLYAQKPPARMQVVSGADYEARTRYLHLGKVALYQMS